MSDKENLGMTIGFDLPPASATTAPPKEPENYLNAASLESRLEAASADTRRTRDIAEAAGRYVCKVRIGGDTEEEFAELWFRVLSTPLAADASLASSPRDTTTNKENQ